jgi:hypothetical protein
VRAHLADCTCAQVLALHRSHGAEAEPAIEALATADGTAF